MKRKMELKNHKYRKVFEKYTEKNLRIFSIISLSLTLIFYTIWCILENIKYVIFTPIIVALIFIRYDKSARKSLNGNPVDILLKDKLLVLICIIYVIIMITLLELFF